jgi:small-conductance mechanosensitive channel
MSQYPSPYNTPYPGNYGYDPAAGLLAPARRAAILMFILGGLSLACSVCLGSVLKLAPLDQMIQERHFEIPDSANLGMTPEQIMRIFIGVVAVLALVKAIVTIILAIFVRRGGIGSIVTSIVLFVLVLLVILLQLSGSALQAARGAPGQLPVVAGFLVAIALYGLLLTWLFQAARAAPAVRAMRTQSQLWQMQQQQQMYGQGGYAPPPPPPLPPSQTPPPAAGG